MRPDMAMQSADGNDQAVAGGGHLPELAAGMLRGVADRARRGRPEVGETMRDVCHTARLCGLRAEQLLVVLKEAWRRLPEARGLDRHESEELLARVIHDCIEAYYDERPR